MTLEEFKEKFCVLCGTQRCDPDDPVWREGCLHYQELDKPDC